MSPPWKVPAGTVSPPWNVPAGTVSPPRSVPGRMMSLPVPCCLSAFIAGPLSLCDLAARAAARYSACIVPKKVDAETACSSVNDICRCFAGARQLLGPKGE